MHRITIVTLLCCSACSGPSGGSAEAAGTPATPPAKGVSQNTEKSPGDAAKATPTISLPPPGSRKLGGSVPGPVDPAWFRLDLFQNATLTSSGRTPRDEQGLFSTQMLFALAEGTTTASCLETLQKELAPVVPELAREEGKDGRVTLRGSNADYQVTAICGEAKGKPSAYVSYRWLRPPPEPTKPAAGDTKPAEAKPAEAEPAEAKREPVK